MFARRHRLPNERLVKRLYAKGKRLVAPTSFCFVALSSARATRFSVVCGRKVSAKAVERNRLKRVARSVAEARLDSLPRADYLVVLRPAARDNEAKLRSDLEVLLTGAGRPA